MKAQTYNKNPRMGWVSMANQRLRINVDWSKEGARSVAKVRDLKVIIDEPVMLGGTNQGPNPVEYVLVALGGCMNVLLTGFAEMHGVELRDVKTTVEGVLDPEGYMGKNPDIRAGFQEITYFVEIDSPSDPAKVQELLEHAERACPVKDTLTGVPVHFKQKVAR